MSDPYAHLAAASVEIEGRRYGGGVIELEPTEAERLLSPANLVAALPVGEFDRPARLVHSFRRKEADHPAPKAIGLRSAAEALAYVPDTAPVTRPLSRWRRKQ